MGPIRRNAIGVEPQTELLTKPTNTINSNETKVKIISKTIINLKETEVKKKTEIRNSNEQKKRKNSRKYTRFQRFKKFAKRCWRKHGTISSEDLSQFTHIRNRHLPYPIKWDMWRAIYCDARFGNHKSFNKNYFYLALTMCIAQGNYFQLATFMANNGGFAFLVILLICYLAFGYPILLMETMVGQYSGRKPLQMLRFMCPALSGLGIALYVRTFALGINALATYMYALYFAWDSYFCRPKDSVILKLVLHIESTQPEYTFSSEYYEAILANKLFWWCPLILIISILFLMCDIQTIGWGFSKILIIFYLGLAGYFLVAVLRTGVGNWDSITYLPFHILFKTDWTYLYSGMAWIQALYYVIRSLALGTLIHPYLGSKSFFHYHSNRDAVYIIIFTIIWNITIMCGALLWLGYICVNPAQLIISMKRLNGLYGMLVVFFLKHFQSEMASQVEPDILFFNGCFVAINGLLCLASLVVYMFILIDCAYTEDGYLLQKLKIMAVFMLVWSIIVPSLILSKNGFRHMIFIDFYINRTFSVFFIVGCYLIALLYGVNVSKFMFDIVNMVHYKGLKVYRLNIHYMNILRGVGISIIIMAMIVSMFDRPYPNQGNTIWNAQSSTINVGNFVSAFPFIVVLLFALYYIIKYQKIGVWKVFRPHRDFFKNKHHFQVCYPHHHKNETTRMSFVEPTEYNSSDSYSDDEIDVDIT